MYETEFFYKQVNTKSGFGKAGFVSKMKVIFRRHSRMSRILLDRIVRCLSLPEYARRQTIIWTIG